MNYRNENKISDKEILKNICKNLYISIPMLSEKLEVKAGRLYEVTNGRNCLSTRLINKILINFSNVNPNYLNTGKGEVLIDNKNNNDILLDIYNKLESIVNLLKEKNY